MSTTVAPLPVETQLAMLRTELARNLAHAEKRKAETVGTREWLVWSGRADACSEVLATLNALAS